jgi:hypothetical protein
MPDAPRRFPPPWRADKIPADDLDVTAIAWRDLHDRITRETGHVDVDVRLVSSFISRSSDGVVAVR